jgi:hypothetical protein
VSLPIVTFSEEPGIAGFVGAVLIWIAAGRFTDDRRAPVRRDEIPGLVVIEVRYPSCVGVLKR